MTGIIGGLVGPVGSTAGASASSLTDSGQGYDFAIGGLGFRAAINDERPYERATAQFRKDALDTGNEPGDSSLLGYWTKGQLSFHGGAGITYYDNGPTVANRYRASEGVDPFTPGEATLFPSWATVGSHSYATRAAATATHLGVLTDGALEYWEPGGSESTYTPETAAIALAAGGGNFYCALGDKTISRVGLSVTYPLIHSNDFEASVESWFSNSFFDSMEVATLAVGATAHEGTGALEITWPASATYDKAAAYVQLTGLTVGAAYTIVANIHTAVGTGANVSLVAEFISTTGPVVTEGAYVEKSLTFVATNTSQLIGVKNLNLGAGGEKTFVDKVRVYRGSRTGYDAGGVPTEAVYSHSELVTDLHYAKDRLLAKDESGNWYQLAPNPSGTIPVAIASGDKLFTATGSGPWSVADTPGPILFANGSRIFAVTQGNDGAFPALSAPIQVADLPSGESISAITHYLGYVVIVTNLGVRVAVLSDSGTVTYGPRLTEWDSVPEFTTIARKGERVLVAGDHRIVAVDLSRQVGQGLEFAWADAPTPWAGTETNYGVIALGAKAYAWSDSTVSGQDSVTASGWLTTGLHRMGTLEPKRFHRVSVRVGGTAGTVQVYRVLADGTETSLYTIDVANSDGEDLTIGLDDPVEAVGLKFVLTSVGRESPVLLGYQLRALPAPKRQRLIRIPLLLQDVERRGTTRATGADGAAWERLAALEDMEATSGTVRFQDFRTGEAGMCQIEQVEFRGTTPPGRQSDGFGGVVFVTLRKL